jgi:LPS sulfotransferase NodH
VSTGPAPTPIRWSNLTAWARHTAIADRERYPDRDRRPSVPRLVGLVRPSLAAPIFVIGAPRSGTTFLGQCLAGAPGISYHYEPVATKAAGRYVHDRLWSGRRAAAFYRGVYRWLMRLHGDGDLRFAEKTPTNVFVVPFLAATFPSAVFVHIIRDGRDATVSHREEPWLQAAQASSGEREPGGYPFGPWPQFWVERERWAEFAATTDVHRAVWAWRRYTEAGLRAGAELPGGRYVEVRYERLVADPEPETVRLLDALDITAPTDRAGILRAASRASTSSVGRWREALTGDERATVRAEAGPLLDALGYGD